MGATIHTTRTITTTPTHTQTPLSPLRPHNDTDTSIGVEVVLQYGGDHTHKQSK